MAQGEGNEFSDKRGERHDRAKQKAQRVTFLCPGCKISITGHREFSDHKNGCARFDKWKRKFIKENPLVMEGREIPHEGFNQSEAFDFIHATEN